ncbi:MAG: D-alanyl-D-alanine carboxypeptidase [Proteobacteria bacterium]|nr:D-alanyl-D-alanine carboxypeptidase [Pseudomonadota bacterium]MBU1714740.1 D-alanyl-D-alanine carboxypeptidase [Pseudomonadota bacterium]
MKTILLLLILLSGPCFAANPSSNEEIMGKLIINGGYAVHRENGTISSRNADQLFVPASITKIATALAALHILGPEFRFETLFFLDDANNLYIKGMGDPFLVSEEIEIITGKLNELGVKRINDIILDNSSFQLGIPADGTGHSLNPYDVTSGALSVNFNTTNIKVSTSGAVSSAEPQTPALPIMQRLGQGLPPGVHRINVSDDPGNITIYTGQLFRAIFKKHMLQTDGQIREDKVAPGMSPFYIHRSSKGLTSVIEAMMRFSNNFIANQLFLTCGTTKYGYPADWPKGQKAISQFLQENFDLKKQQIHLVEGSGLSRKNRLSPKAMIVLLNHFKPYATLLQEHNGTILKSGTLTGVYSYAGYFINHAKGLDSFVIILNQNKNNRDPLLNELKKAYGAADKLSNYYK